MSIVDGIGCHSPKASLTAIRRLEAELNQQVAIDAVGLASLPMHGRRGQLSRQPSAPFPAIAPKDERSVAAQNTDPTSAHSVEPNPLRTRLPPRSRLGCW